MRCLIVDDSTHFVAAARGLLEHQGVTVVGVAATGADALRRFEELRPDVTLVDVDLGAESGFDVAEQLLRAAPAAPPPVILISTHAAEDFADLIETSPATGFVAKSELSAGAIHDVLSRRDADTSAPSVMRGGDRRRFRQVQLRHDDALPRFSLCLKPLRQ